MKYNGVILKKFAVMDDEIARLRGLGDHLDDLIAFRNEVTGAA